MTDILRIATPFTAWLAAFSAVYGLQGLTCSPRWPGGEVGGFGADRVALTTAWAVAITVQAAILLALRSPRLASPRPFARNVSLALAIAALVAVAWTLLPVVATSTCL